MALFLEPVFQQRIWGGSNLEQFGYDIPTATTGECWGISAHPHGPNRVINGPCKGETLDKLWKNHRELFDNDSRDEFPLLTKILDANDKLSVQVHPDDDYARQNAGESGKTECWYILDCKEDAEIIYGVDADSKKEVEELIDKQAFDDLFHRVKVKPGDFYYVPAGTVHAIGEGIMILETQQSSDTTYRIYDYNRKDKDGNARDLHLEESKAVIDVSNKTPNTTPEVTEYEVNTYTEFVSNHFFTVGKWEIAESLNYEKPHSYCLISVIEGNGVLEVDDESFNIEKGTHFILTSEDKNITFKGQLTFIVSYS